MDSKEVEDCEEFWGLVMILVLGLDAEQPMDDDDDDNDEEESLFLFSTGTLGLSWNQFGFWWVKEKWGCSALLFCFNGGKENRGSEFGVFL